MFSRISSGRYILLFTFLLLILNSGCSDNPTGEDTKPTGPATILATPTSATPGTLLTITGYSIDTTRIEAYYLIIGGQPSLLISDSIGGIATLTPFFFSDTSATWPTPPAEAVDIEIYLDSSLVAVGKNLITIDSLVEAPGSTLELVNNTIATVESYKTILRAIPTEPGYFEQMVFGITAGLDSLIAGGGDSSLTSLLSALQTSDPEAVAFLDAIYNSSGAVAKSQQVADAMAAIADTLSSGTLKRSAVLSADVALAASMQLSTLLKLYGDAYIHGAAETASNISFVSGWIGMLANLSPPLLIINTFISATAAATSLMDIIFNKMIVTSLPTIIDSMTISLPFDTIATGDTTNSTLRVFARNDPVAITAGDLINQFLSVAGLLVPQTQTIRDVMLEALNFIIGQIRTALSAYHSANPQDGFDPALFDLWSVPDMRWDVIIRDPRLLDLHSTTTNIINIDATALEWYSTGNSGTSNITITAGTGDDATLIPTPPFIADGGNAFGIADAASAFGSLAKQVAVMSDIALIVDFADVISSEGSNVLGVRAGTISILGDTNWTSGLNVALLVIGGGADPTTGTTDASGLFNSLISLDPFSDTVIVDVRVTGTFGGFAATEVMAAVEQTITRDTIPRIAFVKYTSPRKTLWTIDPFDTTKIKKILTLSTSSRPYNLLWAPGYTMFSYNDQTSSGAQLWIANRSGRKRRVGTDLNMNFGLIHAQWAETDSSRFVYNGYVNNGLNQVFVEDVFSFSRDTLFDGIERNNAIPRFSPDGQFIAYFTHFRDFNQPIVYTISRSNPDGTNTITLVDGKDARELVWSANGSHIIFISSPTGGPPYTLYKVASNGDSPLQTMATHPIISSIHTIPGTRNIMYAAGPTGTSVKDGIYIQNIDDLSIQLVPNSSLINSGTFDISPDGLYICFYEGGNIFIIEIATGIRTQITNDGVSLFPTWSRW